MRFSMCSAHPYAYKLHIYLYIYYAKETGLSKENLVLTEEIEGFIQKKVTPFETGAKVDCPKEYLGRTVYLVVCKG